MLTSTYLHSDWEFIQTSQIGSKVGTSHTEWLPAAVPGHVHLDLVANGIIADPFLEMSELGCQWVDEKDWSYRTTFNWTPKAELPSRVLRFEGVDTVCSVFLNGTLIGEHDNMFTPLEIDVSGLLIEGHNELRVDFKSAVQTGRARRALYFGQEGLKDHQEYFTERAFVRKAQYMSGWDWGPRLVSCGIWRPVSLVEFSARLLDVYVRIEDRENELYLVNVSSEFDGAGTMVHCLEGAGCLVGDGVFVVKDPEKWSPTDPRTYTVTSAIYPSGADLTPFEVDVDALDEDSLHEYEAQARVLLNEHAHDVRTQEIGFRQVRLVREPDEFGESFEFEVNGRPLWARGANWIPDHSFPSLLSRTRTREQLERCVDMGFNMLRVWGGGLYETDEFYEICDELGILVWQDFPFACSYYPDDEAAQAALRPEAEFNIRRLRNHPSLAMWCGNNENHEMYFNAWGGEDKRPPRYYGQPIYESMLPGLLAALDPGRAYIPSSPIGALNEGAKEEVVVDAKRRGPNGDGYGDQHNWDVWHGRGDWRFYTDSKGRFSSEYGFASAPTMECWQSAGISENSDYMGPIVRWHDKTAKGYDTFVGYVELHYPKSSSLGDWIYYSQLNQRDALRTGVEHYRRSVFCRGSLIWQVNDCWPVQSWAILDSLGRYKALAYELRRLHADWLLSIERDDADISLWAANDGVETWSDRFTLSAYDTVSGETVRTWKVDADCEENARGVVLKADISGLNVNRTIIVGSAAGVLDPVWRLLGEPKNTVFPKPDTILASTHEDGVLRLHTPTPVIDLMLLDEGSVSPLIDNFITVPEPGFFEVRVAQAPRALTARSLAGHHPIKLTRSPI